MCSLEVVKKRFDGTSIIEPVTVHKLVDFFKKDVLKIVKDKYPEMENLSDYKKRQLYNIWADDLKEVSKSFDFQVLLDLQVDCVKKRKT